MKLSVLVCLLVLGSTLLAAPEEVARKEVVAVHSFGSARLELPEGASEVTVPFRLVNQHIVLTAKVNGQGPFRLVLDTGMPAEGLALNEGAKVEALNLKFAENPHVRVAGVGGEGKARPARMALGLTVEIGSLKLLETGAALLPPIPGFAAYSDGVIGASLFRHLTVTVDNDRKQVILRRQGIWEPSKEETVIPLTDGMPAPSIEARVVVEGGEPKLVRLVVDLGASHPVSLLEWGPGGVSSPARSIETVIGRGLGGPLTGKVGRIRSLDLGGLVLNDVVATFPDKKFQGQRGMDTGDGNLGNGALSRFNVTLDFASGRMALRKAAAAAEPFEWDMSGIQADPTDEGIVRVREVIEGSPAAEAGVKKGDILTKIAGEKVDAESYFDLRDRLRKAGDTVTVDLRRGDKPIEVSLKLRRLI